MSEWSVPTPWSRPTALLVHLWISALCISFACLCHMLPRLSFFFTWFSYSTCCNLCILLRQITFVSFSKPSDHVMLRLPCCNSVFQALKGTSPFEVPFSRWTHCYRVSALTFSHLFQKRTSDDEWQVFTAGCCSVNPADSIKALEGTIIFTP